MTNTNWTLCVRKCKREDKVGCVVKGLIPERRWGRSECGQNSLHEILKEIIKQKDSYRSTKDEVRAILNKVTMPGICHYLNSNGQILQSHSNKKKHPISLKTDLQINGEEQKI